jgi:hypothetical protein
MNKLKLVLDDLRIESFQTGPATDLRGTVRGNQVTGYCTVAAAGCTVGGPTTTGNQTRAMGCNLSFPTVCGCDENTMPLDPTTTNVH